MIRLLIVTGMLALALLLILIGGHDGRTETDGATGVRYAALPGSGDTYRLADERDADGRLLREVRQEASRIVDAVRGRPDIEPTETESGVSASPPAQEFPAPTSPVTFVPDVSYEPGSVEALVLTFFPDDPHMVEVARRESINFRADVVYGPTVSPTNDRGLMQINAIHAGRFAARGWDYYVDAFDPVKNLTIAREIYDDQGPGAWTTYQ